MFKWPQRHQKQYVYAVSVQSAALHIAILKARKGDSAPSSSHIQWQNKSWELVVNDDIDVTNNDYAGALKKLLKRYDRFEFKKQPLQFVLSSAFVERVSVDKPELEDADIAPALQWTLKDLVQTDPLDMVVDYFDVPLQVGSEKKIIAVVASQSFLQPLVAVAHDEGFDIQGIVHADLAFTYWFAPEDRVLTLSQTRHGTNELNIVANQKLILNRELSRMSPIGQMSPEKMGELEGLALEIQRSLDFYTSQLRQAPLTEVVLATAHSRAAEIVDIIGAQLGMQSSVLRYPKWANELKAGDFTDLAALSGLAWVTSIDSSTNKVVEESAV